MTILKKVSVNELIKEIYSEEYTWKGYANGDTVEKFQARKAEQTALILLVVSRVITGDKIEKDEAVRLFYDHVRHLGGTYADGLSGTSILDTKSLPNLFKLQQHQWKI